MRSNMLDASDIGRPSPIPGVKRAGKNELPIAMAARRFKKQFVNFGLAVSRVRAHVAEVGGEVGSGGNVVIVIRINTAEQRPRKPHSTFLFQFLQYRATGEGQYKIKLCQLAGAKIIQVAGLQRCERDWSIQIVEDAERTFQGKDLIINLCAFRKVAGRNDDVRIEGFSKRMAANLLPIVIERELAIFGSVKITTGTIVGNVFLKKMYAVTHAVKRADDGPIWRGMAVAPGRGDCQPKNRDLHK